MNCTFTPRGVVGIAALLALSGMVSSSGAATTSLADQPIFAATVPGNLVLDLSVEYPTANSVANIDPYDDTVNFPGYFDSGKCYTYVYNAAPWPPSTVVGSSSYFQATAFVSPAGTHQCGGNGWSGNLMNWLATPTIDPFRQALTGGYRSADIPGGQTILEKGWASGNQGGTGDFPYRGTDYTGRNALAANLIPLLTPLTNWTAFDTAIAGNGNLMVMSASTGGITSPANSSNVNNLTSLSTANTKNNQNSYQVFVRVLVCDTSQLGAAGVESNCVKYGSNYKPQGLMQTYANTIRYAAMSYLNSDGHTQQGGVLREPMGFIGPTYPTPLSATVTTNTRPEWSATDGHMYANPDTALAAASGVAWSGVMNYLNKFGEYAALNGNPNYPYMTDDNVSELYYAAVRYLENLNSNAALVSPAIGPVTAWDSSPTATQLDGFPAVVNWTDPILYYCQKNFILGIGDDHTHTDYNVGGAGPLAGSGAGYSPRPDPSQVAADTFNQAYTWTTELETLEGSSNFPQGAYIDEGQGNTYFIAGLAYGTHVLNIRPDLTPVTTPAAPISTISTYWFDVEEGGGAENLNQYYLAAKYGGFTVPSTYSLSNTTPLPLSEWDTTGNTILMNGNNTHYQPDNYFLAGNATLMESGLAKAFANISNAVSSYSSAYALSTPNITSSGNVTYASQYNSTNWTDTITAQTFTFDSNGNPNTPTTVWVSSTTLQNQLASGGWQTARRIATYNGSAGVAFETTSLTASQLAALTPSSYSTNNYTNYLNYLRGDQSNEVGCTVSSTQTSCGTNKSLRTRTLFLGDVVDASLAEVTTPTQTFTEGNNPGYAAFKTKWTTTTPRPTMVYAAANDGMVHGFVGSSGLEQFAYIPSATFQGPTGTPQVNGLAALGNPAFVHHYYVDATPIAFDIDLNHTGGNTGGTPNWHTLLIGGLAKGGMSFYAIDVTDPASMTSESAVAGKVAWEFPNSSTDAATASSLGYSFGAPIVVKTAQYGWVVAFTSGYNSSSSVGYLYLVNPANGALLQKIATSSASSGLTQASAYVQDYTDYTADSIYVGDLNGQLWRFDLTETSGNYPAATQIAQLDDAYGTPQPITTAPLIEIHPTTRERYVMVGTGEFLSTSDVTTTGQQSFYVIIDGTGSAFSSTITTPITRSVLAPVTASGLVAGLGSTAVTKGWYIDLGNDTTSGYAWRVDIKPAAYNGTVSFAAFLPSGNACALSGLGEIYSVNYATATSVLSGQPTGFYAVPAAVVNLNYIGLSGASSSSSSSSSASAELIAGLANGTVIKIPQTPTNNAFTRILNWRELPTVQ